MPDTLPSDRFMKSVLCHTFGIPEQHLGYEVESDEQRAAAYEASPKPRVAICQECNSPIIDGDPSGHRVGCKSNQEIEF